MRSIQIKWVWDSELQLRGDPRKTWKNFQVEWASIFILYSLSPFPFSILQNVSFLQNVSYTKSLSSTYLVTYYCVRGDKDSLSSKVSGSLAGVDGRESSRLEPAGSGERGITIVNLMMRKIFWSTRPKQKRASKIVKAGSMGLWSNGGRVGGISLASLWAVDGTKAKGTR